MSNFSRTAVSLAPAYFHHWRSNSRISRSRSLRLVVAPDSGPWRAFAASMRSLPAVLEWCSGPTVGDEPQRCHSIRRASADDPADGGGAGTLRGMAATEGTGVGPGAELGWGILATGKIAHTFARDLALVPGARLAAVGSRRLAAAQEVAAADAGEGTPTAHGSYEDLVADPDVDVVYVATPHALHLENVRMAFEAGKHVLCEKPVTLDAADAEEMVRL